MFEIGMDERGCKDAPDTFEFSRIDACFVKIPIHSFFEDKNQADEQYRQQRKECCMGELSLFDGVSGVVCHRQKVGFIELTQLALINYNVSEKTPNGSAFLSANVLKSEHAPTKILQKQHSFINIQQMCKGIWLTLRSKAKNVTNVKCIL
jgi:hypothetical protein